ncbi:hypothetical protein Trydic_g2896 [Trypoxylus dichotomus]
MPPKTKLHKFTGKIKPQTKRENEENPPELQLSPEAAQQFELELCWCIQQLQTALKSGKLNPKQIQDHTKALNVLMNNSTAIVKKRQVMRLSFGDYRAKMAAEDKKSSAGVSRIKISQGNPSKKSVFLKKAAFGASDNSFRFNFPTPNDDGITNKMTNVRIEDEAKESDQKANFHFVPSGNRFRFNFSADECKY